MMNYILTISLIFISLIVNGQNLNIVNCGSQQTNQLEYNTGEIFVLYEFDNIGVSKDVVDIFKKIESKKISDIILYPNPIDNYLLYQLPENFKFESVEVFDNYQKKIFLLKKNQNHISFDNLPSGVYYVKFNSDNKFTFSVIKK